MPFLPFCFFIFSFKIILKKRNENVLFNKLNRTIRIVSILWYFNYMCRLSRQRSVIIISKDIINNQIYSSYECQCIIQFLCCYETIYYIYSRYKFKILKQ